MSEITKITTVEHDGKKAVYLAPFKPYFLKGKSFRKILVEELMSRAEVEEFKQMTRASAKEMK